MKETLQSHKAWVSEVFDRAAPQYGEGAGAFFDYFGKRLVEQIPLRTRQHTLDIATGKGAVLFPLAEEVGPSGRVVGIDISEQMIVETTAIARKKGLEWIELLQMDAEKLEFSDHSFDCVFCGFALFFFPSLEKALAEFKRVLKPGGTLAVTTWGEDSFLDAIVHAEIGLLTHAPSLIVNPIWSLQSLQEALNKAGFKNICIREETKEFIHSSFNVWWNSLWTLATRAKLENLSPEQLDTLQARLKAKILPLDKGEGIMEELQVFYGIAEN